MRRHVFTPNRTAEERQDTPLLERRREQASRRWPGGAEARPVFGRDQFVPGGELAQGGRGFRRGGGRLPDAGLVSRGSLRGRGGRFLGGAAASVRSSLASSAAMGRLLGGRAVVARPCNSIGSGPSACRRAGSERAGTDADFEVLLYDLTSSYFEVNASDLPE